MLPEPVPQLCFGQVRHARTRPAVNRFGYGVYFIRLPLRTLAGGDIGGRLFSRNRFNLLAFHDRDHGDGQQPLLAWIDGLLAAEGIADADGEVWLQTMPRVLGYVFNPVSFWFCHRRDGALRAVVCDVRNTFGERHCYLLEHGGEIIPGAELTARKVFHVSPFCAVEGHYRFRFLQRSRVADTTLDAAANLKTKSRIDSALSVACIDYHDESGLLLQTSLSGRAGPVDDASVARAFFGYPLMTFGVVMRIHLQALRLWLRRVPFFSKPVPPQHKVSR